MSHDEGARFQDSYERALAQRYADEVLRLEQELVHLRAVVGRLEQEVARLEEQLGRGISPAKKEQVIS